MCSGVRGKPPRGRADLGAVGLLPSRCCPGQGGRGAEGIGGGRRLFPPPRGQGGRAWQLRGAQKERRVGAPLPPRGACGAALHVARRGRSAWGLCGDRDLSGAWAAWLLGLKPAVAELTSARGGRVDGYSR